MARSFIQGGISKPGSIWGPSQENIALDSSRGINAVGGFLKRIGGGLSILIPPNSTSSGILYPFQISIKNIDGGYQASLYPGTLNQQVPTNMFNTIDVSGGTSYVILTGSVDGYSVSSSTWSITNTAPTPQTANYLSPSTSFEILIGIIIQTTSGDNVSNKIYQITQTNFTAQPEEWVRETAADPQPFGLPYDIYYYWVINEA
jgi:hypothetical protein